MRTRGAVRISPLLVCTGRSSPTSTALARNLEMLSLVSVIMVPPRNDSLPSRRSRRSALCRTSRVRAQGSFGTFDRSLHDPGRGEGVGEAGGLSGPQRHELGAPLPLSRRAHVPREGVLHGEGRKLLLMLTHLEQKTVLYAAGCPPGEGARDGRLVLGGPEHRLLELWVGAALLAREEGGSHLGGLCPEDGGRPQPPAVHDDAR